MTGFTGFLPNMNPSEMDASHMRKPNFLNYSKRAKSNVEDRVAGADDERQTYQTSRKPIFTLSEEGGNLILFDGEILNFDEFVPELKAKGLIEETFSQRNIFLALLGEYGMGILPRLNGGFVFAYWLKEKQQLILGSDRFGTKNLFWSVSEIGLIFSTDIHLIFEYGFPKRLNQDHLDELFFYRSISGSNTIFSGVNKVLPGHIQVWNQDQKKFSSKKWFDLVKEILTERTKSNPAEWVMKILNDSTKIRTQSDTKRETCIIRSQGNQTLSSPSESSDPKLNLRDTKIYANEIEFTFELISADGRIEILKKRISSVDYFKSLMNWMRNSQNPILDSKTLAISLFFRDSEVKFTRLVVDVGCSGLLPTLQRERDLERVSGIGFSNWIKSFSYHWKKDERQNRLRKIKSLKNPDFQLMTFSNQFFISDLRKLGLRSLNLIPESRVSILEEAKSLFPHDRLRQLSYLEFFTEEISQNERWEQFGKENGITIQKPFLDSRLVVGAFSLDDPSWKLVRKSAHQYTGSNPDLGTSDWMKIFLDVPEFRSHLEKMHESPVFKFGWLNFLDVSEYVKEFENKPNSTYHLIEFLFFISIWYQAQFES